MAFGGQDKLSLLKGGAAAPRLDSRFLLAGRCGAYMGLGLVMACARVLESGAPFGMAMVACAGAGVSGVFALTGAALGYLVSGGIEWGIRYIAAAVLVYTIAFVFHELEIYKNPYFMPTAAALVMGFTGFLGSFSTASGQVPLAAELFLEIALAFGGSYFFREALDSRPCTTETAELRHSVSVMILAACLLMAISRLVLFDTVSIGRVLALVLVMTSAMKGGMLTGAAVGTVLGLAMDVTNQGAPFYTMAYALSGLLSGVFGKHGRVLFVLSFILSGALAANSVAIRMSGDEFMVLIRHGSEELLDKTCAAIEQRVQHYNATAPAGSFQLSFSTGVAKYEGGSVEKFLVELDRRMYAEKRAFHAARDGHAAPEQGNTPSI